MAKSHQQDIRRVVVIGPCASGKTSLTSRLQALGYDARACGQEHSEIAELWRHLEPDVLVGLRIDLETLRARRSATWSHRIYERQIERLRAGFEHADIVIDSNAIDQEAVLHRVVEWLQEHPRRVEETKA